MFDASDYKKTLNQTCANNTEQSWCFVKIFKLIAGKYAPISTSDNDIGKIYEVFMAAMFFFLFRMTQSKSTKSKKYGVRWQDKEKCMRALACNSAQLFIFEPADPLARYRWIHQYRQWISFFHCIIHITDSHIAFSWKVCRFP